MDKKTHPLIAPLLLVALVAFAGCGGGDDGSDDSAPTKAAFIKEADAICAKADKAKIAGMRGFLRENDSVDQMSRGELAAVVVDVGIPPIEEEVEELRELTAPAGDEETFGAMLDRIEEGIEKAKAHPVDLTAEQTNPFKQANIEGKAYGFVICSEFS